MRVYERIVAAAIQAEGVTLSVPRPGRHCDVIREAYAEGISGGKQGFLTSDGRFVTRYVAARIARKAKQIDGIPRLGELTSEDLW